MQYCGLREIKGRNTNWKTAMRDAVWQKKKSPKDQEEMLQECFMAKNLTRTRHQQSRNSKTKRFSRKNGVSGKFTGLRTQMETK